MNYSNKYVEEHPKQKQIENKIRGKLSYYTINQVADLLKEDINKIRYYTNIFDDILKIDILNKELRYTEKDINKLELLMNLHKKGMSLKEIQEYYNKLPSINEEEENFQESNLISVSDLINALIEAQQSQFTHLKNTLLEEITEANSKYISSLTNEIIDIQKNNFIKLKDTLINEIEKSLEENLNNYKNDYSALQNDIISNITSTIVEKIDAKNNELQLDITTKLQKHSLDSLNSGEELIKEVKDFKRVINNAYYTQNQVDNESTPLLNKLLKKLRINLKEE